MSIRHGKEDIKELLALPEVERKAVDRELLRAMAADAVQVLTETENVEGDNSWRCTVFFA